MIKLDDNQLLTLSSSQVKEKSLPTRKAELSIELQSAFLKALANTHRILQSEMILPLAFLEE